MKRTILAVSAALAAMFLASIPAQARLDLAGTKCVEPNLAPSERVKYCKLDQEQGTGTAGDRIYSATSLTEAQRLAGDYAGAEATATIAMVRYSDSLTLLSERSIVYAEDGKYDLAIADADRAVGLRSDNFTLGNRCWMRAVANKDLDIAIADCNSALAEHRDAPTADSLAFAYYRRGDFKAALDNYNTALDLFSHQWSSLYMRGIVKTRMGDASGKDDIGEAMNHAPFIADEFAGYGVKP